MFYGTGNLQIHLLSSFLICGNFKTVPDFCLVLERDLNADDGITSHTVGYAQSFKRKTPDENDILQKDPFVPNN
jgi:hypothetical protein